jgi:hypothetical protein
MTGCASIDQHSRETYESNLAQVSSEILAKIIWEAKIEEVYAEATDEFRESVNIRNFYNSLEKVYTTYPQEQIIIDGYESYPDERLAVVYAKSESGIKQLHYRLVFIVHEEQDFTLTKLGIREAGYSRSEKFVAFSTPVLIEYEYLKLLGLQS